MRFMYGMLFLALISILAPSAFGAEPMSGYSSMASPDAAGTEENPELYEYYIEGKQTVEGVILDVDPSAGLMTIRTQAGDLPFVFDKDTRFRIGLKPGDLEDARVGLKMAGLYVETDGTKRLARVMVLKDLPPSKHKVVKKTKKKKTTKKKAAKKKKTSKKKKTTKKKSCE